MPGTEIGGLMDGGADERSSEANRAARAEAEQLAQLLYARQPEDRVERRLDATARALELLGDPQRSYGVIHVAGTNGKSSTVRIAGSILRAHGLRVGVFTSPHLVRLNERINIDGEPIDDERLVAVWRDIEPYIGMVDAELAQAGRPTLTFFEVLTVLGFAAFADAPCDVIVLEVGMGGEWDSTNVADGDVAVFTPVALDHMAQLGSTIAEIAQTKSGIIKQDAIVVSAEQTADAMAAIMVRAGEQKAVVKSYGTDFAVTEDVPAVGGQEITVRGLAGTYPHLLLPLLGEHQARNAALAIAAVEAFIGGGEVAIGATVLEEGLITAESPGRLQLIATQPPVVIDAAHNPHGAAALARALTEVFPFTHTVGIVGVLRDKDVDGVLRQFEPVFDTIVVTASHSARALSPDELAARAVPIFGADRVVVVDRVVDALAEARDVADQHEGSGIVVSGSITVIGEVAAVVAEERADRGQD